MLVADEDEPLPEVIEAPLEPEVEEAPPLGALLFSPLLLEVLEAPFSPCEVWEAPPFGAPLLSPLLPWLPEEVAPLMDPLVVADAVLVS